MPVHKQTVYEQVAKEREWDCAKDGGFCMDHGPFPSEWRVERSFTWVHGDFYKAPFLRFERYVKPFTLQYKDVPVSVPSNDTLTGASA